MAKSRGKSRMQSTDSDIQKADKKSEVKSEKKDNPIRRWLIYFILEALRHESSPDNPIRATEIMNYINNRCGTKFGRTETIVNQIEEFNDFLYDDSPIEICYSNPNSDSYKNNKYYCIAQKGDELDYSDILILKDQLLYSHGLSIEQIQLISKKLDSYISYQQRKKYNAHLISDGSSYSINQEAYLNREWVQMAIDEKYNIKFDYCEYNLQKKLVPKVRSYEYIVSPYKVLYSNGRFYLIGLHLQSNEKRIYRLDKIKNVNKGSMKKLGDYYPTTQEDINDYIKNSAFMYADDKRINVKMRCEYRILDDVIERFEDCRLFKEDEKHFLATILDTTQSGMKIWALQFSQACEVLEPAELREEIKKSLQRTLRWYGRGR